MKKILSLLLLFVSIGAYSQTMSIFEETDSKIVINQFIEGKMDANLDLKINSISKPTLIPEVMEIKGQLHYVNRFIYAYNVKEDGSFNVYEIVEWINQSNRNLTHITLNFMNKKENKNINNSGLAMIERDYE